jgi:response regulator of citrate/malate metabolism
LTFLQKHPGQRFTVTELAEKTNISYATIAKWIEVLNAENSVKIANYGNLKQIWVD